MAAHPWRRGVSYVMEGLGLPHWLCVRERMKESPSSAGAAPSASILWLSEGGMTDAAPPETLCDNCRKFHPSQQKFITGYDSQGGLPDSMATEHEAVNLEPWHLGFLDEIYSRLSYCSFCRLIFDATQTSAAGSIVCSGAAGNGRRVPCQLEWQLDGRFLLARGRAPAANANTRRLRVFSEQGVFPEFHIMLLDPGGLVPNGSVSFLAREIQTERFDIGKLRNWLRLCLAHHATCSRQIPSAASIASKEVRFIDLEHSCVVEAQGPRFAFAALSYQWGAKSQEVLLTGERFKEFTTPGFFNRHMDKLHEAIRDAILLLPSLGYRYLWVDALCIVQDSADDWRYMASIMHNIYSSAALTVCCATGTDHGGGLQGMPQTLRSTVQPIRSVLGNRLVATKTVEDIIERSPWNRRAWTFQERMLSRRCLIFTQDRVFFQCLESTWSEEVHSESPAPAWTLDNVRSPYKVVRANPIRQYTQYVESYSGRALTFQKDRLIAFAGLESALYSPLGAISFFGLPDTHFDFGLLWDRKDAADRVQSERELTGPVCETPSWSWCGWYGAAAWRLDMVAGCLLNLHEWLTERTWIVWYTTPKGVGATDDFHLVWKKAGRRKTGPDRWHGYDGAADDVHGRRRAADAAPPGLPTRPTGPARGKDYYLYFWSWTAFFRLSRTTLSSRAFAPAPAPGLRRFGLGDAKGDWCGTVVLEDRWLDRVGDTLEFVALSEARDFSMQELDTWTYYVPEDRDVSEWYAFYALMITWNKKHEVAERVGLAKIYKDAFENGSLKPGKGWREIVLG